MLLKQEHPVCLRSINAIMFQALCRTVHFCHEQRTSSQKARQATFLITVCLRCDDKVHFIALLNNIVARLVAILHFPALCITLLTNGVFFFTNAHSLFPVLDAPGLKETQR
jgi:hypothetical protein